VVQAAMVQVDDEGYEEDVLMAGYQKIE